MRYVSLHSTKQTADKFADKLRKLKAKGVSVGKKTNEGYPVYSTLALGTGKGNPLRGIGNFQNPLV